MQCPSCGHDNIPGSDLCESCGSDLAGLDLPEAQRGIVGKLLTGRVRDLPMAPRLTVEADASVAAAIAKMREARHGCVLVESGGELAGVFTERDVLVRVVRPGLDTAAVKVAEVMTPKPRVVQANDPPAFALHRMVAQSFRHIPVLDGDRLEGFVSARSVLRFLEDEEVVDT